MVRALGWLICVGASLALAQKPGRIEGTVTNSVTGAGVRKAQVHFNGLTAMTDSTGHFALENVPPGTYQVQAYCPGYSVSPPNLPTENQLILAAEQQVKDYVIKIKPLSVIAGKVLDENGDPMARVQMMTWRSIPVFGRHLIQSGFTMTNDRGQFRIFDLEPGKYFVQATPMLMGPPMLTDQASRIYPSTYYPSGPDVTQALVQEVKPGQELTGLEFRLKKQAAFHIHGIIDGQQHRDGGGPQLVFYRAGRIVNVGRTIRPDGSFTVPSIIPGEYELIAYQTDGKNTDAARTTLVISDHDVDDVKMTLEPSLTLHVTTTTEGTAGVLVTASIRLMLSSPDSGGPPGTSGSGIINEDGTFEVSGLLPTLFSFQISWPSDRYVKSIQLDGQEIQGDLIDLRHRGAGELHITFGTDFGTIKGTTVPLTMLTAAPLSNTPLRRDQLALGISNPDGSFQFSTLAPGTYQVMAWGTSDMMAMNPDVRKELSSRATTVKLGPHGNETVQLTVIPADEIAAAIQKAQ